MATFWASKYYYGHELPAKIQAQKIRNISKTTTIYIFDSKEDVPVSLSVMKAFALVTLDPGQEVDLTINPYIMGVAGVSLTDYDVCLHADGGIDVEIESSDICDRWIGDRTHPWNGNSYPCGTYTKAFTPVKNAIPPAGSWYGGAGGAGHGSSCGSSVPPSYHYTVTVQPPIEHIMVNINITADTPKCTCGEKGNRHPGKCSSWCDLVLDANKQLV